MSAELSCKICRQASNLKCGNCLGVFYCCKEHQKLDWKNHKPNCLPYKIVQNEKLGRHLLSTRIITEGEIIIKEAPLVSGPAQVTSPVCLGCYTLLNKFNTRDCSLCGWPVCSEACEKSDAHRPECQITFENKKEKVKIKTIEAGLAHPSYQCLTVLRCLHLKKTKPDLWEKLMKLESHSEDRKSTPKYSSDQLFIGKFIPQFFKVHDFSEEEIMNVAGIVQVNAHEIPLKEPGYISIYEKASMLEHNCRANCMKSFTNSGDLVVRAAVKIPPGEHLSICYADPLWGKDVRINYLKETKFFSCQCIRCTDPTELGTHFNSLKCTNKECLGYSIPTPRTDSSSNEANNFHNRELIWTCDKCATESMEENNVILAKANESLYELNKKSKDSCMSFINSFEKLLHPNHHLMINVKLALIDLFGMQKKLLYLEDKYLEWTIKTCREINELASLLVPAENRLRGVLLYQLQFALTEYGRRKISRLEAGESELRENLLECKEILSECYKLLNYEPDELPEGKMAIEAKNILESVEAYLQSLKSCNT